MTEPLEEVARVLSEAEQAYDEDIATLENVDTDKLYEWTSQPDVDTDGKDHD